jgi:hypothetical protein
LDQDNIIAAFRLCLYFTRGWWTYILLSRGFILTFVFYSHRLYCPLFALCLNCIFKCVSMHLSDENSSYSDHHRIFIQKLMMKNVLTKDQALQMYVDTKPDSMNAEGIHNT